MVGGHILSVIVTPKGHITPAGHIAPKGHISPEGHLVREAHIARRKAKYILSPLYHKNPRSATVLSKNLAKQGNICRLPSPQSRDEEPVGAVLVGQEGHHTPLGDDIRNGAVLCGEGEIKGLKLWVSR